MMTRDDLERIDALDDLIDDEENYLKHLEGALYDLENGDTPRPIVTKYALIDCIEYRLKLIEEYVDERDDILYS